MINTEKIRFTGEPFFARVFDQGDKPLRCVPIVYDGDHNCGVGLLYETESGKTYSYVWGLITPRDLISSWRGTEILRRLDTIDHGTPCAAYYAGIRTPSERERTAYIEPVIAKIGRTAYEEIMAMPVPEQIVRSILDNQRNGWPPSLYPITEEVRVGTITWRQEFADAGIEHPDEEDAKPRVRREMIEKFKRPLASYAKWKKIPREHDEMVWIENVLLKLVKRDAFASNPEHVLVALAGIASELEDRERIAALMWFTDSFNEGPFDRETQRITAAAIERSARWLSYHWGRSSLFTLLNIRQKDRYTYTEATELLTRLIEKYFPSNRKPDSTPNAQNQPSITL